MSDLYRTAPRCLCLSPSPTRERLPPATPQFTPRTPPAAGPRYTIAAVGDGVDGSPASHAVANLVRSWNPNVFAYLGDVYDRGSAFEFDNWYADPEGFGPGLHDITNPTVGNHEYMLAPNDAAPYFAYWGNVPHYYSYDVGGWHVLVLDSTTEFEKTSDPTQLKPGSPQYDWLAADLAAHQGTCMLAYMHHPRYSAVDGVARLGLADVWSLLVRPQRHHGARRARAHLRALDPAGRHRFSGGGRAHAVHRRHRRPRDPEPGADRAEGRREGHHSGSPAARPRPRRRCLHVRLDRRQLHGLRHGALPQARSPAASAGHVGSEHSHRRHGRHDVTDCRNGLLGRVDGQRRRDRLHGPSRRRRGGDARCGQHVVRRHRAARRDGVLLDRRGRRRRRQPLGPVRAGHGPHAVPDGQQPHSAARPDPHGGAPPRLQRPAFRQRLDRRRPRRLQHLRRGARRGGGPTACGASRVRDLRRPVALAVRRGGHVYPDPTRRRPPGAAARGVGVGCPPVAPSQPAAARERPRLRPDADSGHEIVGSGQGRRRAAGLAAVAHGVPLHLPGPVGGGEVALAPLRGPAEAHFLSRRLSSCGWPAVVQPTRPAVR